MWALESVLDVSDIIHYFWFHLWMLHNTGYVQRLKCVKTNDLYSTLNKQVFPHY